MLSDLVAEQLKRIRDERGLTREQLAARCQELQLEWPGTPGITYGVITSIETGRRGKDGVRKREVSVDELMVLAYALDVPPVLLVAPVGHEDVVEVLPGKEVKALRAYEWLVGDSILEGAGRPRESTVIDTYKEFERAVLAYMGASADGDEKKARRAWTDIQNAQRVMQSFKWRIPPLPGQTDDEEEERKQDG